MEVDDEQAILEEALENLQEAHRLIRATQARMRSAGLSEHPNYQDLTIRLSVALATAEAAYMEIRRRLPRGSKQ